MWNHSKIESNMTKAKSPQQKFTDWGFIWKYFKKIIFHIQNNSIKLTKARSTVKIYNWIQWHFWLFWRVISWCKDKSAGKFKICGLLIILWKWRKKEEWSKIDRKMQFREYFSKKNCIKIDYIFILEILKLWFIWWKWMLELE